MPYETSEAEKSSEALMASERKRISLASAGPAE